MSDSINLQCITGNQHSMSNLQAESDYSNSPKVVKTESRHSMTRLYTCLTNHMSAAHVTGSKFNTSGAEKKQANSNRQYGSCCNVSPTNEFWCSNHCLDVLVLVQILSCTKINDLQLLGFLVFQHNVFRL